MRRGARTSAAAAERRRVRRRRRGFLILAALLVAVLVAVAGAARDDETRPGATKPAVDPDVIRRITVGRGETGATIVVRGRLKPRRPVVVFLHGWRLIGPEAYREWIDHLARGGNIVIVPRYQKRSNQDPAELLGNVVAGLRSSFRRVPSPYGPVIAAGHSAGAALAADYAAIAQEARLPVPDAVFAVFPGRAIRADASVPVFDPARIDPSTRVVALVGSRDEVVGSAPAQTLIDSLGSLPPERRRLVTVTEPAAADHFAPVFDRPAVRRQFWARLDQLIRSSG